MRALFCAAAFVSCVAPGLSAQRTLPTTVTIVYHFDGPPPEFVLQEIKDELQILVAPSSLQPTWQDRKALTNTGSFENLIVVDFHGRCSSGLGNSAFNEGHPLGRTQVAEGKVLPFVDIECGPVQSFLRSSLGEGLDQNYDVTIGRALARVLAHELYHVLVGTTSHSRSGIAKRALSGNDLASDHIAFATADVDRMKLPQERTPAIHIAGGGMEFVQ